MGAAGGWFEMGWRGSLERKGTRMHFFFLVLHAQMKRDGVALT